MTGTDDKHGPAPQPSTRTTANEEVAGSDPGGTRPAPADPGRTMKQKVRSGDRNDGTTENPQ